MVDMSANLLRSGLRSRRHGEVLEPSGRRHLERSGWRTTLDYREDHVRGRDGRLLRVEPIWTAEAERYDGQVTLASATGASEWEAWANLCDDIDVAQVTTYRRVRLAPLP